MSKEPGNVGAETVGALALRRFGRGGRRRHFHSSEDAASSRTRMGMFSSRRGLVAIAILLSVALLGGSAGPALAAAQPMPTLPPGTSPEIVALLDALDATVREEIDLMVTAGEITPGEGSEMRGLLLKPGHAPAVVAPVILGMVAGCALKVFAGELTTQLHKLVKEGRIDEASDIAKGATIDCVLGAIPGAAAKNVAAKVMLRVGPKIKAIIKQLITKFFR
jgi:hypothetical protein